MSQQPPRRLVLTDATVATLEGDGYGLVENGMVVVDGSEIRSVGSDDGSPSSDDGDEVLSLEGRLVTPGLIDCHTHLVYGGSRAREFEQRLEGASYEEIARAGGGIFSTVDATRTASDAALLTSALRRLDRLLAEGVTVVEVKSGYGLDLETERRMLRVARRLGEERPVTIKTTFLGAHAVPREMTADDYLDDVCIPALKALSGEGLVDAVDGFCEGIAFSPRQIIRLFEAAKKLNLPVKLHAEQLSALGGAALAAKYGALSADHLEHATAQDIDAMATAGTVAVLLPGAYYFLRETKVPPIDGFRAAGVPMAVATDSNPGSSPMTSVLLAMNMAATLFGLTPIEALRGSTVNAARALGLSTWGQIAPGYRADLAIWDVTDPAELTYRMGDAPLFKRIVGGVVW